MFLIDLLFLSVLFSHNHILINQTEWFVLALKAFSHSLLFILSLNRRHY